MARCDVIVRVEVRERLVRVAYAFLLLASDEDGLLFDALRWVGNRVLNRAIRAAA